MNVEDILRKYKAGEVELGFDDIHIEEFNDGSKEIFMERTIEGLETGETISLLFPEKEHVKELKLAIEEVETTLKVEAAEDFGDSDATELLKEEMGMNMNKANHAIEISLKGNELNEETLLKVLETISKEIQNDNKDIFISRSVNENFLDELVSKYDNHETPFLKLNEELSNKQIKSYKDNFKNFNSDFKLIKNDKDDFSILLSSQNKEVLSDAIRIIPKMKRVTLENDSVIQKQKELESLINKINSFYENDEQGLAALDFAKAFDNLVTALEINHEEIKSDQTEQELQETLEDFMYTSDEESRELMNVYSAVDDEKLKTDDIYNGYELSDAEKEHVKELKLAIEEVETALKVEAAEDFGDSDTTKLLKEELEILRERWAYTLSDEGGGQFDYDNPAGISIDGGEIEWIETNNEVTKTRKVDWEP